MGLFGYLKGAVIKNLRLDQFDFSEVSRVTNTGLLAGVAASDTIIDNCIVNGKLDIYSGNKGAIVGKLSSRSRIVNCHVDIILDGAYNIGGVAGECLDSTIERCFVEGKINCDSTHPETTYGGGLVGHLVSGEVKNCYTYAALEVKDAFTFHNGHGVAGGLVGYFEGGKLSFCYISGEVSGYHSPGAIYGKLDEGQFDNVINHVDGTGRDRIGCVQESDMITPAGISNFSSYQMKTPSLFAEWDHEVWAIKENEYPHLSR